MSGDRSLSQAVRFSIRCLIELTFQVAIRMEERSAGFPGWEGLTTMPEFAKLLKDLEQIAVTGVRAIDFGRVTGRRPMLKKSVKSAGGSGRTRDERGSTEPGLASGPEAGNGQTDAGW